jgi:hypothetical protein
MTASVDLLGLSRSFVKGLLAKTRGLHTETISERKNGPRRLAIIESHALNSLDRCAKKIRAALAQHQAGGLVVQTAMEAARLTPYINTFCPPKNHGFSSILKNSFPVFL